MLFVFLIFFHTLNHPWIFYDEGTIYEETAVPIPGSFNEIFQIISSFGLSNNLSSSNYLYSSNTVTRANIFGAPFLLILGFFLKKNALLYHSLNLFLHLANTTLVYLILRKIAFEYSFFSRPIIVLSTLLWAIHPTQAESVLLTTNIGATLSYFVFFILFYDFLKNKEENKTYLRKIILPICFLIPMLLNEYIIMLPIILFIYSLIENCRLQIFTNAIKKTWEETLPYLAGLFIYSIYFLFSSYKFAQVTTSNSFLLNIERIFWLSPQIFVHYLKLISFPAVLSVDQTSFVKLGKSLLDPYSIACFVIVIL